MHVLKLKLESVEVRKDKEYEKKPVYTYPEEYGAPDFDKASP
jgi:hypothetical protein